MIKGLIDRSSPLFIILLLFLQYAVFGEKSLLRTSASMEKHISPVQKEKNEVAELFKSPPGLILDLNKEFFRDTTIIEFEKRQVTLRKVDNRTGIPVWEYHYDEMDKYLKDIFNSVFFKLWRESWKPEIKSESDRNKRLSLDFRMPIHYPPWARRVLGTEPPRLTIEGYQEIGVSFNSLNVENLKGQDDPDYDSKPHFEFDHNNSFTIKGSVGRLINVKIQTGSEQEFDMDNPLKKFNIEYKEEKPGELEDEIIQEVVAGYTNFQMPGAGLSGYSGSHEGLFGIKVKSKLGPLALTTIMSHEQGETNKTKATRSKGGGGGKQKESEKNFLKNRFFFLDSLYLDAYLSRSQGNKPEIPRITGFDAYVEVPGTIMGEQTDIDDYFPVNVDSQIIIFKKLKEGPDEDYYLDRTYGWVRFNHTIDDEKRIGVFLRTQDPAAVQNRGDSLTVPGLSDTLGTGNTLWILKERGQDAEDPNYELMWKNVYSIPNVEPSDFNIFIWRINAGDTLEKNDEGTFFTHILGLADENGKVNYKKEAENADGIVNIFDFSNGYYVIPPFSGSRDGNKPFLNPDLGKTNGALNYDNEYMYTVNYRKNGFTKPNDKFSIIYEGVSAGEWDVINLDWGISPNTEVVKKDGSIVLERNRDYTINYDAGTLRLISEKAKSANTIEAEYQKESLFTFERRAFLGLHGKVDFPLIGRDSYFAGSILYQNTSAGKKIPRIGQEPFNKLLFGLNTKIDLEPEWMTSLVNYIPLVNTKAVSSVTFNAEVAHSKFTPNTGSKAYIENFESSSRIYDLTVDHNNWYKASPPSDLLDSLYSRPPAWDWYWFTPEGEDRTEKKDIIKYRDAKDEQQEDTYAQTMKMRIKSPPEAIRGNYDNPWAGIMTTIPSSISDRTEDSYIEIWMKNKSTDAVYIDFGLVSEDLSLDGGFPNGHYDREDTSAFTDPTYVDDALDLGLDGLKDEEEYYLIPNSSRTGWDSLRYGDERLGDFIYDPSRDNFEGGYSYHDDSLKNRIYVNRQQGDQDLRSEDINNDYFHTKEEYFRVKIDYTDLSSCPFIEKDVNATGDWNVFKIPIGNSGVIEKIEGSPSWEDIRFVRVWTTDIDKEKDSLDIEIYRFRFVGNKWRTASSEGAEPVIEASTINNKDHRVDKNGEEYYSEPKQVYRQIDYESRGDAIPKEHALRINYGNIEPGGEALVERAFSYQKVDLSPYSTLQMYVKEWYRKDKTTWFFFRFGLDSATYYEYRTRNLSDIWDDGVAIDLRKISKLKLEYIESGGGIREFFDTSLVLGGGSVYSVKAENQTPPSLSNIRWMAFGVKRDENAYGSDSGEIWINDMQAAGISELSGTSFRSDIKTAWADFMEYSMNLNYDDADFRKMSESSILPRGSELSGALNAQWHLDKFLPDRLGVNIPVGGSVTNSLARPKIKPQSDIYLLDKEGEPDRLGDMAEDFVDQVVGSRLSDETTEAEYYQRSNVKRSWYTSFNKGSYSDNPLVNFTADRISTSVRFSRDSTFQGKGEDKNDPGRLMHGEIDRNKSISTGIDYDLSPRKSHSWSSWSPFKNVKADWLPRQMKNYKLTYLPSTLSFNVADVNYGSRKHVETLKPQNDRSSKSLDMDHGFHMKYDPVAPIIETSYDMTMGRDFDDQISSWGGGRSLSDFSKKYVFSLDPYWKDYFITHSEVNRSQKASIRLTPEFFDWITHSAKYSADYSQNMHTGGDEKSFIKANTSSDFTFRTSFRIRSLFSSISGLGKKEKGFSAFFGSIEDGLSRINLSDIDFDYGAKATLHNQFLGLDYLSDEDMGAFDFFLYKMGIKNRDFGDIVTGNIDDKKAFGGMANRIGRSAQDDDLLWRNDSRNTRQNWKVSTDFKIPRPLDISISSVSLGWQRRYTVKPNSFEECLNYNEFKDTVITFPEISARATTPILEKIPLVNKNMRNLNLSSSYSYSLEKKISMNDDTQQRNNSLTPLVSLNGKLKKWPINLNYSHNYTKKEEEDNDFAGADKYHNYSKSHENVWGITYQTTARRTPQIKIFKWEIPIKGELSMSMNTSYKHDMLRRPTYNKEEEIKYFSINPEIVYSFTDNVTGTMYYTFTNKENSYEDEVRKNQSFALKVRINF